MARVYSKSQGKFIETGNGGSASPVQENATGNGAILNSIFAAMIAKNPKNTTAIKAMYDLMKPRELTAAEQNKESAKKDTDRVITQLEDFYFGNKLYYGNNIRGIYANTLEPIVNPNTTASRYKGFVDSAGAFLAKAAGDSGNVALQEQLLAKKPFPSTRFEKGTAIDNFKQLRKKFGLPERDYDDLTNYSSLGIQELGGKYGL